MKYVVMKYVVDFQNESSVRECFAAMQIEIEELRTAILRCVEEDDPKVLREMLPWIDEKRRSDD